MLVLYSAAERWKEHVMTIIEREVFAKDDAEDIAPSHFDLVKDMANKFMTLT
jgi:hypothetical protein